MLPLVVASIVFAGTCAYRAAFSTDLGGVAWRTAQEDKVREAVFRWQIAEHSGPGNVCFLTLHDGSPAQHAAFIRRFAANPLVLALPPNQIGNPASPMLLQGRTGQGFTDARTGKRALHFWIDKIEWQSDIEAEVSGGGAAASLSGNSGVFTVEFRDRRWIVTNYRQTATM